MKDDVYNELAIPQSDRSVALDIKYCMFLIKGEEV